MATGVYVHHPLSLEHDTGGHPENANRIRAIEAALGEHDWAGLERAEAPAAQIDQLTRVHTPEHVLGISELAARGGGAIDMDTVASERSYDAAARAAGGAIWATEQLLGDRFAFAFCGLRPPGHHAERARAMGFCLFNNVAVAVAHALEELGVERAFVLDWDVHHGNGTAEIFDASDRVLYTSIHQSPLYPGTGSPDEVGTGPGAGWTVNLPVPAGSGPELFMALVQHVAVPLIRTVRPGLVAISAGYDAHRADPLANCMLDETAYAAMAVSVMGACRLVGAPLLICLEGGYDLSSLARSVMATVGALAGDVQPPRTSGVPAAPYLDYVRQHWPGI